MILREYGCAEHQHLLSTIDDRYPVFFLEPYSTFIRTNGHGKMVLVFSDCGSICAPVRLFKVRFFKLAQFEYPPVRGGQRLEPAEEADFLASVVEYFRRLRVCHRVIQSPPHCLFRKAPPDVTSCRFGTYVLDLRARSEGELLSGLHPDHRREIRQARDRGVQVEFGASHLEDCFRLCSETMQRSDMSFMSREDFTSFHRHLSHLPNAVCGVAYHQGVPLGALWVPFTKARAFYISGGSAAEMTVPGANKLLHWETIQYLRLQGVAAYDFVGARLSEVRGTKLENLQRFKARFGGILEQGCLWKTDLARPMARLFDFLLASRQRLRGKPALGQGDIIDQERRREAASLQSASP